MKEKRVYKRDVIVPILFLIALMIIFTILSGGKFASLSNIGGLLDQSIVIIIGGLGTIFVIAIGSVELSNSGVMAIATLVGGILAQRLGTEIPSLFAIIIIAGIIGLINGIIVTKFHVNSFLETISMMMILRGLFVYIQKNTGLYLSGKVISVFFNKEIQVPILIVLLAISYYFLEYTRFGKYCIAIGENENLAINIGIPVDRIKIIAFTVSGIAAGIAGIFMMAKMGGVTNSMGDNYHMDVMMALFLGGILVTGGISTKTIKLIIGALTLTVLKNGLIMIGLTQTAWSQSTRGIAMMAVLYITMRQKNNGKS